MTMALGQVAFAVEGHLLLLLSGSDGKVVLWLAAGKKQGLSDLKMTAGRTKQDNASS